MTNNSLAYDYYKRAKSRIKILYLLKEDECYPDVIRETQELVELLTKGWLRKIGIEPPKWHDVGPVIKLHETQLPEEARKQVDEILSFTKYLRKERENSFYGDEDLIPLESFSKEEAEHCIKKAEWIISLFDEAFSDQK